MSQDQWVKTLKKAREATKPPDTRYNKGAVHNIYDENFDGENQWTFRDEVYGSPATIIDNDFNLKCSGAARAQEHLGEFTSCFVTKITLLKPSLRSDNADRIVDLIPSEFVVDDTTWYILGYGAYRFKRAQNEICYTCYLVNKNTQQYALDAAPPCLRFFTGLKQRVVFKEVFFALSVTQTPEWIYGQDNARPRQSSTGVQNVDEGFPRSGGESTRSDDDVDYFENAVQSPRGR